MIARKALITAIAAVAALGGCKSEGDIVIEQGVGITALRTLCPAVGVPDFTGNVTMFSPADARTSDAIDVTAYISNVRPQCNESGAEVYSLATFDVRAMRSDPRGARSIQLPFYSTVLRGGNSVVSKRIGNVTLNFADGQTRAEATGQAAAYIDREAATLPSDIRQRITKKRRARDVDAAIDPLTEPDVIAALAKANFELLIGFQLTDDQLRYNATR
jgi:hypothetical protein